MAELVFLSHQSSNSARSVLLQAAKKQELEELEEARCQHQEKWSFAKRAPPTRGASLIAWDEPISSDSGKNMVAALKKDWKLWSDGGNTHIRILF